MNIPISTDLPDLEHVQTTPQAQLNLEYQNFLSEQISRQRSIIIEALMWCSLGETARAQATLTQGLTS